MNPCPLATRGLSFWPKTTVRSKAVVGNSCKADVRCGELLHYDIIADCPADVESGSVRYVRSASEYIPDR